MPQHKSICSTSRTFPIQHEIASGESIGSIARKYYGFTSRIQQVHIRERNAQGVGTDLRHFRTGRTLTVPAPLEGDPAAQRRLKAAQVSANGQLIEDYARFTTSPIADLEFRSLHAFDNPDCVARGPDGTPVPGMDDAIELAAISSDRKQIVHYWPCLASDTGWTKDTYGPALLPNTSLNHVLENERISAAFSDSLSKAVGIDAAYDGKSPSFMVVSATGGTSNLTVYRPSLDDPTALRNVLSVDNIWGAGMTRLASGGLLYWVSGLDGSLAIYRLQEGIETDPNVPSVLTNVFSVEAQPGVSAYMRLAGYATDATTIHGVRFASAPTGSTVPPTLIECSVTLDAQGTPRIFTLGNRREIGTALTEYQPFLLPPSGQSVRCCVVTSADGPSELTMTSATPGATEIAFSTLVGAGSIVPSDGFAPEDVILVPGSGADAINTNLEGVSLSCGLNGAGRTFLFVIDPEGQLYLTTEDAGGFTAWEPVGEKVTQISAPARTSDGAAVFFVDANDDLRFARKDVETGIWSSTKVETSLPLQDTPQATQNFALRLSTRSAQGLPIANRPLTLTADSQCVIIANGHAHHIDENRPAYLTTNDAGVILVRIRAQGIACPRIGVHCPDFQDSPTERTFFAADTEAIRKLAGPDTTGAALMQARIFPDTPKMREHSEVYATHIRKAAQAMVSLRDAQDDKNAGAAVAPRPAPAPFGVSFEFGGDHPVARALSADELGDFSAGSGPLGAPVSRGFFGSILHWIKQVAQKIAQLVVTFAEGLATLVVKIGSDTYHLVTSVVADVGAWLGAVFAKIAEWAEAAWDTMEAVLNFIRAVFDWDSIKCTAAVVEHMIAQSVDGIAHAFADGQDVLADELQNIMARIDRIGAGSSQTPNGFAGEAGIDATRATDLQKAHHASPQANYVLDYAMSDDGTQTGLKSGDGAPLPINPLLEAEALAMIYAKGPEIAEAAARMATQLPAPGAAASATARLSEDPLGWTTEHIVTLLKEAAAAVTRGVFDLANILFALAADAFKAFKAFVFETPIHIPIFGAVYDRLHPGEENQLHAADFIAYAVAVPASVGYAIAHGGQPLIRDTAEQNQIVAVAMPVSTLSFRDIDSPEDTAPPPMPDPAITTAGHVFGYIAGVVNILRGACAFAREAGRLVGPAATFVNAKDGLDGFLAVVESLDGGWAIIASGGVFAPFLAPSQDYDTQGLTKAIAIVNCVATLPPIVGFLWTRHRETAELNTKGLTIAFDIVNVVFGIALLVLISVKAGIENEGDTDLSETENLALAYSYLGSITFILNALAIPIDAEEENPYAWIVEVINLILQTLCFISAGALQIAETSRLATSD